MGEWTTFWFEGNLYAGIIKSLSDWAGVVDAYKGTKGVSRLLKTRDVPNRAENLPPKFGFAIECDGDMTLADWAKEQGMYDLLVGV